MSLNLDTNNYKIINLTEFGTVSKSQEEESEDFVMCNHCEKQMQLAYEDIVSSSSNDVLVKKDQYYCRLCGLIQNPSANLITKKREQQGPKISKRRGDSLNNFVFEVIRFDQESDKPKEFDIEESEEERLRAEGCTIKETRVTSSETGRTIVRRYS